MTSGHICAFYEQTFLGVGMKTLNYDVFYVVLFVSAVIYDPKNQNWIDGHDIVSHVSNTQNYKLVHVVSILNCSITYLDRTELHCF